jgi:beta-glucosidase
LNIGYRWYDAKGIAPAFPFGHGLSYTTFRISDLSVRPRVSNGRQPIQVQFVVENTGRRAGAEVPQVYLGMPPSCGEPPQRLVGFEKVRLEPGEKKTIQITIDQRAANHPLGYWDGSAGAWAIAEGDYTVYVGTSSRHAACRDSVTVRAASPALRPWWRSRWIRDRLGRTRSPTCHGVRPWRIHEDGRESMGFEPTPGSHPASRRQLAESPA